VLGGAVVALACTGAAGFFAPSFAADECDHAAARVSTAWSQRSAEVRDAFAATDAPYAAEMFARIDTTLAAYGTGWSAHVLSACDSALANDERRRRRRCLEQQAWDVESLVDELAAADAKLVQRSASSVFGLSAPGSCDAPDDAGLAAWEPDDDEARAHAVRLRQRLSEAHARSLAGRYASAAEVAAEVVEEAERLNLQPIALVARIDLGRAHVLASELALGSDELAVGYWDAIAGGHDVEAARAASAVGFTEGYKLADTAAGRAWSRHALAALDRLDAHDERRAEVWSHLGSIEALAGNFAEARRWHLRALEIREGLASERPDHVASTLNNLGNIDVELGDYAAARANHERALQLRREALGDHHPHVATSLNNLGSVLLGAEEFVESRVILEQALTVWEAILGPDHVDLLGVLHNLAVVAAEVGDVDAAERYAARGLAIAEAQLPDDHPQLALALTAMALVALERGRPADALASFERAHRIAHDTLGAGHHHTGSAMHGVGLALRELGRHREAAAVFAEAHAILKASLGDDHDLTLKSARNHASALEKAGA
jgi:tetratricopeptide (TPR) repeat protein